MSGKICAIALAALACGACKKTTSDTAVPTVAPVAEITVVGCVKPADQSATGTVGTSGSTSDTKYMLSNAKSDSNSATTYRIDANDATVSPEVDHQVEIVAAVEEPGAKAPVLKVTRIKTVAVPCP